MPSATENLPGSDRRQVDREIVTLLRENHKDNREIISLLREVALLLERTGPHDTAETCCADTGIFQPILGA